jgi:hypothetical protein
MAFSLVTGFFLTMLREEFWSQCTHSELYKRVEHFKSMWEIKVSNDQQESEL